MWLIDMEAAPPRIRGLLSRWSVEVRAGVYVGSTSAKVRDAIWTLVADALGSQSNAILVYDARNVQGFEVRTVGANRREIEDVDGLWLAKFRPQPRDDVAEDDALGDDIDEVDPAYAEAPE